MMQVARTWILRILWSSRAIASFASRREEKSMAEDVIHSIKSQNTGSVSDSAITQNELRCIGTN